MRVADVSSDSLIRVDKGLSLRGAAIELDRNEVGVLAIENSHGVTGIFSERDLARAVADDADLDRVQVAEYMTELPVVVDLTRRLEKRSD